MTITTETYTGVGPWNHIADIVNANHVRGGKWFSPDNLRFFNSRILPTVYGGRYFVTSEDNFNRSQKLYTVRAASDDAEIDTVGEFGGYFSHGAAIKEARRLARRLVSSVPVRETEVPA